MNFLLQVSARYKTVFSAYLSRSVILFSKFISVPLLLYYLPKQEYALVAILSGLEAWFLLLDFGMGASLQNVFAENIVYKEKEGVFLKTAFIVSLFSLGIGAITLYAFCTLFSSLFREKIEFNAAIEQSLLLCGFFFVLNAWASIGSKILVGKQKGYQVYLTQSIAHIISLGCLIIAGINERVSLPLTLFLSFGIPSLFSCLLAINVFCKIDWKANIQWHILKRARGFWLFAVMAAVVSLSDSWVITLTLSIEEIIQYNVLCKIFGIASFAYGAFIQGIMPECSQYLFFRDVKKVENLIYRHCFFAILGIGVFTCLTSCMAPFIESTFHVSLGYLGITFFSLYLCIRVVADFFAMALQSHSKLRSFFYLVPIQAALSLSLQYTLSLKLGLIGILIGLSLSYLLTVCWALPMQLRKLRYSYE